MSYSSKELIEVALAEVGYHEKDTNANLDDKTASNDGDGNYTKYARDLYAAKYYNGNKNGFAWCAVFVAWCHYMAAGKDKTEAEKITCQTGTLGAVCTYAANYYKEQGRLDKVPKVGDQVFFGNSETAMDHTGIVYNVDDNYIYTVEGNSSNAVSKKKYLKTNSWVRWFGHPLYTDSDTVKTTVAVSNTTATTEVTKSTVSKTNLSVNTATLRNGSKGAQVLTLQLLLNGKNGAGLETDSAFGKLTTQAVKDYQTKMNLEVDGVVGLNTWYSLINN